MIIICPCGNEIKVPPHLEKRKKYCCLSCKYKYAKRMSGLKYKIVAENKGWFKKGDDGPWKGKKLSDEHRKNMSIARIGKRYSKRTEFKNGENIGEKNNKWKGDDVGYFGLHTWVQRRLGKAKKCIRCNSTKNVQWSNKSHKYLRKLNDWQSLCIKCHNDYDKNHLGAINKKYGKRK